MIQATILSLVLIFGYPAPTDMVKTEVAENIFLSLPSTFRPMTDDEISGKYFSMQRPMAMYTDQNLLVDIGVNLSSSRWSENDISIMKSFQKSNIYSLYDEVEMISEGQKEVNGKNFVYFEFVSTVKGDKSSIKNNRAIKKYTLIQYLVKNGQSLVFNFTCPAAIQSKWQATAQDIMNSVIVKGKLK